MFNQIGSTIQDSLFGKPAVSDQQLNTLATKYGINKKQNTAAMKKTQMAQKMPSFIDKLRGNITRNLTSPGRDSQYLQ